MICLLSGIAPETLADSTNSAWFTRVWRTSDGLPNNNVTAVVQGRDGFLWVGTPVGLARFDGVRFSPFSYRSAGNVADQGVHALLPSQAGGLLVVPNEGPVVCLDANFSRTQAWTIGLTETNIPTKVTEDNEGSVWIAYSGRSVVRIRNGKPPQFVQQNGVAPSRFVYGLITDATGNVWLADGDADHAEACVFRDDQFHIVARYDMASFEFKNTPSCVTAAGSNGVWIANGTQLFKCDHQGNLKLVGQFQPEAPGAQTLALIEDHAGAVWIGSVNNGLFRYDGTSFEKIETSHPTILSLTEDQEGNIWAGTAGGGLDRISRRRVTFEGLDTGSALVTIQSVCEDTNGVLWGAAQNGLLVTRVDGKWVPALTNETWLGVVTCVAADRHGGLWIGTANRQLHHWFNGQHQTWSRSDGMLKITLTALLPAANGDLWMGGFATGVPHMHDGKIHNLRTPVEAGRVLAMSEDAGGNIWIGTSRGQLICAGNEGFTNETPRTPDITRAIRCLYATPDGALWIGYEGLGLGRLKDGEYSRIDVEEGLPDNYISQIVADDDGWLWLGSDHGISKIRQSELEEVLDGQSDHVRPINYGQNEGSPSMEADFGYLPGALRSRNGQLWIPLRTSLAVIDPKISPANPKPPAVRLTRVTVDGEPIAAWGGITPTQTNANLITLAAPLRLPPSHRKLDIEFAALSFSAPENTHFRYRLDGLDTDWIDAETRSASYSRLVAGDYKFRVEASSGDGPWNEAGAPLGIVVDPFFWQTWWFRLGVLIFFTLSVIAVVRYVSFRRLRQKLQAVAQQAALDKERTRIARDLHDDLGGSLTQVKQLFELALRNHASPAKMENYLQSGLLKTQQGIKSLDETVWAVNPHNDTLPHLIDYIGQSAVEFLHAADIRCRVDLPASPPERVISAEARHNLFLTVKEALNNVVRHAHASEVQIQASVTEESLTLTINDNGHGFERAPDNAYADGLRNMQQRMEEIGGRFLIHSRPDAGTEISLIYFWAARKC